MLYVLLLGIFWVIQTFLEQQILAEFLYFAKDLGTCSVGTFTWLSDVTAGGAGVMGTVGIGSGLGIISSGALGVSKVNPVSTI